MGYNHRAKTVALLPVMLLTAVIAALVLLGGCSRENDQPRVYVNDRYGFSINMPADFAEEVEIREEGNIVYFVNQAIQATSPEHILGVVGRIEGYDKKSFTRENLKQNEEMYGLKYLGENDKYFFGWAHATDIQYLPETPGPLKERYRAMEDIFEEVIGTFEPSK